MGNQLIDNCLTIIYDYAWAGNTSLYDDEIILKIEYKWAQNVTLFVPEND